MLVWHFFFLRGKEVNTIITALVSCWDCPEQFFGINLEAKLIVFVGWRNSQAHEQKQDDKFEILPL